MAQEYTLEWADIRLSVMLYEDGFRLVGSRDRSMGILAQWKSIHQHSSFELFFVREGELSLVTEGETLPVRESILVVPPRFSHYAEVPESVRGYLLYLSMEKIPGREEGVYQELQDFLANRVTVLPLSEESCFYLERTREALEEGRRGRGRLPHLMFLLFEGLLGRGISRDPDITAPTAQYLRYINRMETYLAEHFCDPIHLSDLADALYLCPKQTARIIRKEYGCGFAELLSRRRLSAACMLLRYTEMEIGEIAHRVGYEYENYFYTVFRRYYGMTPAQYRRGSEKALATSEPCDFGNARDKKI